MGLTTRLFRRISVRYLNDIEQNRKEPELYQRETFRDLMEHCANSQFGKEHGIEGDISYENFVKQVPLRSYDLFYPYIDRARKGEENVLWDSPINWFAKSSGTSSSRSKFIPITRESLRGCHYYGMKKMVATYIDNNPESDLFEGQSLTLGGSVSVDEEGNGRSKHGDLSAILLSNSPMWAEVKRVPRREIALMANFEKKVEKLCKQATSYNITNFAGVPSWNLVMVKEILDYWGKSDLKELWPNLELFMHGGINFKPYRSEFKKLISGDMNYMESYNASEGYFGFQDDPNDSSMLLLTNNGIFYEFIPINKLDDALAGNYSNFDTIESVKCGINYAIILSTNGGLWRYLIGDTIIFTSTYPHKFIISGRTQLFINAFGEELMIHNAENALAAACEEHNASVENYTAAPIYMQNDSKGAHQWMIEFNQKPDSMEKFAKSLDNELRERNSDYNAKREGDVTMFPLEIVVAESGLFYKWMAYKGKLGGQNKVPRLSNDRLYMEELLLINDYLIKNH